MSVKKYNIGDIINGFEILGYDNTKSKFRYKYKCLKCNYVGYKTSAKLTSRGCPCCKNKIVVKGVNDIATVYPEYVKYFKNKDDVYKHQKGSKCKVDMICPNCGKEKVMRIDALFRYGFSCNNCGDGLTYPEKFMSNFLTQLGIEYEKEYSPNWATTNKRYRYDFYLHDYNIIIEVHGDQHYSKSFETVGGNTLRKVQQNDEYKRNLALSNGIKDEDYIVIDCRKSELNWIKGNIIKSRLNNIFDLNEIDWIKCNYNAMNSLVVKVCKLFNQGYYVPKICDILKLDRNTVRKYLKIGTDANLCKYDPSKGNENRDTSNTIKKVICLNTGEVFDSATVAGDKLNLYQCGISNCCTHIGETYGFINGEYLMWMHYDEYLKLNDKELKDMYKLLNEVKYRNQVICLETKEIFLNYTETAKHFNSNSSSIKNCCIGKTKKIKTGNSFMLLKDYYKLNNFKI